MYLLVFPCLVSSWPLPCHMSSSHQLVLSKFKTCLGHFPGILLFLSKFLPLFFRTHVQLLERTSGSTDRRKMKVPRGSDIAEIPSTLQPQGSCEVHVIVQSDSFIFFLPFLPSVECTLWGGSAHSILPCGPNEKMGNHSWLQPLHPARRSKTAQSKTKFCCEMLGTTLSSSRSLVRWSCSTSLDPAVRPSKYCYKQVALALSHVRLHRLTSSFSRFVAFLPGVSSSSRPPPSEWSPLSWSRVSGGGLSSPPALAPNASSTTTSRLLLRRSLGWTDRPLPARVQWRHLLGDGLGFGSSLSPPLLGRRTAATGTCCTQSNEQTRWIPTCFLVQWASEHDCMVVRLSCSRLDWVPPRGPNPALLLLGLCAAIAGALELRDGRHLETLVSGVLTGHT